MLDKSAFQMLNREEHLWLESFSSLVIPTVLISEILGDASKFGTDLDSFRALSDKFGGSGPPIAVSYNRLCVGSLQGNAPPMNGQIPLDYGTRVPYEDGSFGWLIDAHPLNDAIFRWSQGEISEQELEFSKAWRESVQALDFEGFYHAAKAHGIVLPKVNDVRRASAEAENMLGAPRAQRMWAQTLLDAVAPGTRFDPPQGYWLKRHAPYAYHCLKAMLMVLLSWRYGLISSLPSNAVDFQYLCYLPFCTLFASQDKLHRRIAPHLLRPDQMMLSGDELRGDLREMMEVAKGLGLRPTIGLIVGLKDVMPENRIVAKFSQYLRED